MALRTGLNLEKEGISPNGSFGNYILTIIEVKKIIKEIIKIFTALKGMFHNEFFT